MIDIRRHNLIHLLSTIFLSVVVVYGLAGCSDHRYYADSEEAMDTSGYYDLLDHIAAYYPNGVSLNFPGYIIGFEESSRSLVTKGRDDVLIDQSVLSAGDTVERLVKALRYNVPYISQVMRYEGRSYGEGNCALYNLYHNHGTSVASLCNEDSYDIDFESFDYRDTFTSSWDAIDVLKQRLARDVESKEYTHLIVAVMGLDTAQEEAIRNYKSIVSSIRKEANDSFRPLFVGITWPSFFANRWFDPLWEILAYHPVADRADILGLTWLGVLLNDVIMPLGDRIEVSVIAHSFGARASSMGFCVGPAIVRNDVQRIKQEPHPKIKNFIGLAPAFSLTRFTDEEHLFYENIYYKDYCPMIERLVFTASSNDGAFGAAFWSDAVGDHDYMKKYCGQQHPVSVTCTAATSVGDVGVYDTSAKISYIDTSLLMKHSMPGTSGSGGGHSDIYRPEIGRFLWTVINGPTD